MTKQPGEEGARQSVILSLLVDHSLFVHPGQQDQLKNNLPAYTVGSLRANVQVECLVDVIDDLVSSDKHQEKLQRFTQALHEVFAFGRSKKHMIQHQLGRLEPTPSLEVPGGSGHAEHARAVNLKKLEDRVAGVR